MCRKVRFVDSAFDIPIVKFSLGNGVESYAILDTGSEITTFDKDFILNNRAEFQILHTKEKINLVGMATEKEQPVIHAGTKLYFSDKSGESSVCNVSEAMVMSLAIINENLKKQYLFAKEITAIIGCDVFLTLNAKIDFKNKTLNISDDISCK